MLMIPILYLLKIQTNIETNLKIYKNYDNAFYS